MQFLYPNEIDVKISIPRSLKLLNQSVSRKFSSVNPSRKGFTLIEIMICVVLIGLLLSMSIPAFKKTRKLSRFSAFANDVRAHRAAVELFYLETGIFPNDSGTGTVDPQMQDYINTGNFTSTTPLGGRWDIEADDSGITLAVGVHNYVVSDEELLELDQKFDDGNLTTGNYRVISAGRYYYIIEE